MGNRVSSFAHAHDFPFSFGYKPSLKTLSVTLKRQKGKKAPLAKLTKKKAKKKNAKHP